MPVVERGGPLDRDAQAAEAVVGIAAMEILSAALATADLEALQLGAVAAHAPIVVALRAPQGAAGREAHGVFWAVFCLRRCVWQLVVCGAKN